MKKNNLIFVPALLLLVLALSAACGNKREGNVKPETNIETEISESETPIIPPSAAEAVEKIINEEDIIEIPASEILTREEPETVEVNIYFVKGSFDSFKTEKEELSKLSPETLTSALAKRNIAPVDTGVTDFRQETTETGEVVLYLELTPNFETYLSTMSEEAEKAIKASLANTFLEAYDAESIYLLGESLEWSDTPL